VVAEQGLLESSRTGSGEESAYRNWRLEGRKLRRDTVLEYFRLAENSEEDEEYRHSVQDRGYENLD